MITVCIATYNGGKYIKEQLDSILSQLSADDEVVVSDDCSTDDTLQVIENLGDKRIKVFNHKRGKVKFTNDYATANFENALRHASGDIIFLSDQDDVWMADKVATMLRALEQSDMAMSDCMVTDGRLNVLHPSYSKAFVPFSASIIGNFMRCGFLGSCMAFRRCVLDRTLPFPRYGVGHDIWLGMVGLRHYRFAYVPKPLMKYRRHTATVTMGGKANSTSLWFKVSYRLYLLKAMLRLI